MNTTKQEFKKIKRIVKSSGRIVDTIEFDDQPNVFFINNGGTIDGFKVNGPYPLDDNRFIKI